MQGTAKSGSGLRAYRVDQGSATAAMGSTAAATLAVGCWGVGGTAGSGLAAGGLRHGSRAREGLKGR